ncbi:hypothetical protein NUSPORA_00474 [Nucleospora cyclopteri]
MLLLFSFAKAELIEVGGVTYGLPPNYLTALSLPVKIFFMALFPAFAILSVLPLKKYEPYKFLAICTISEILLLNHFGVTEKMLSVFSFAIGSLFLNVLLFVSLSLLNLNSNLGTLSSIIAIGYLFCCQLSVLTGFIGMVKFLFMGAVGALSALLLQRMNEKLFYRLAVVAFSGWSIFCFASLVLNTYIYRALDSSIILGLFVKLFLILADLLAFVFYRNEEREEEKEDEKKEEKQDEAI